MPLAVRHTPFVAKTEVVEPEPKVELKVPQARVLTVLLPPPKTDPVDYPLIHTRVIAGRLGVSAVSETIRRAFRGLKEGSASGTPHKGLLALGYAEEVVLDVDGLSELAYKITDEGIAAITEYLKHHTLHPVRSRESSINNRYKRPEV